MVRVVDCQAGGLLSNPGEPKRFFPFGIALFNIHVPCYKRIRLFWKQYNDDMVELDHSAYSHSIAIYLAVKFQIDTFCSFCVMLWTEYSGGWEAQAEMKETEGERLP